MKSSRATLRNPDELWPLEIIDRQIVDLKADHDQHVDGIKDLERRIEAWAIPSGPAVVLRTEPCRLGPDGLPSVSQEGAA